MVVFTHQKQVSSSLQVKGKFNLNDGNCIFARITFENLLSFFVYEHLLFIVGFIFTYEILQMAVIVFSISKVAIYF